MSGEQQAETDVGAAISITREAQAGVIRPLDPKASPLLSVTVPDGYARETIDLRSYLPTPDRAKGTVTLKTAAAFEAYVKRHDDEFATTVWVDPEKRELVAVLNDHVMDADLGQEAGWGDHRAVLRLDTTDAWKHWANSEMNGKLVDQDVFAEHIEDGAAEIVKPHHAELLEIVLTMEGHTSAEWKSHKRLKDGTVQLVYSEEATATAGGTGMLEIPDTFELLISPFRDEEPLAVTAKLRYRVKAGKLEIGYKLMRPDDVLKDAVDLLAAQLGSVFGVGRVFQGVPRTP